MEGLKNSAGEGRKLLAVDGQDVYFHFGKKKKTAVLNGVNVAVNLGEIYSLLGPSGCGKTTLLKCIVGQNKPQAGSLKIYGRSPGSKGFFIPGPGVGYMPQDLALYMEMTIGEIVTYFGTLFGLSTKSIKERIAFLVDLLELPDKKRLIQNLSGGQQRRVSFAIALVHKPPLLILDEPTVGVDPLLRKTIWDHLVSLTTNEHITILITTHYTEEARQAHRVGLMRNGQLLVEKNPEDLIKECGGCTLEDVFLKLCQRNHKEDDLERNPDSLTSVRSLTSRNLHGSGTVLNKNLNEESCMKEMKLGKECDALFSESNNHLENSIPLLPLSSSPKEFDDVIFNTTKSWKRLFYLTRKNFLRLKRNIHLLLFTVTVSAIQVAIFFLCFSSDPHGMQVAVANEEHEGLNKLGETFLHSLSDYTIYQKPFENFSLAYESLEKGESWGALHIDSEFSTCLVDRVLEGETSSNDTLQCSTITLILDTSNSIIATTIKSSLWTSYLKFAKLTLESLGKNPKVGELPLKVEEYSRGSTPGTFAEFTAPALIMGIAFVMSIGLTQMSMIAERKHGLLGRTIVAGATTTEVLLSFFFALVLMLFLQIALMLVVTFAVFQISCNGPMFWFVVSVTLTGLCGMAYEYLKGLAEKMYDDGIQKLITRYDNVLKQRRGLRRKMNKGFLISAVTDDENAASMIAFGSFFPVVIISGMFWPVESMPYYLRYFSYTLPLTRIIESGRSVMTRGWNITHNHVWDGYLICSFWTIVYMALSIVLMKIRN